MVYFIKNYEELKADDANLKHLKVENLEFVLTFDEKLQRRKFVVGVTFNNKNYYDLFGNPLNGIWGQKVFYVNNGFLTTSLFIRGEKSKNDYINNETGNCFTKSEMKKIEKYCRNVSRYCVNIEHDDIWYKSKYSVLKLRNIEKTLNKLLMIQHDRVDIFIEKDISFLAPQFGLEIEKCKN